MTRSDQVRLLARTFFARMFESDLLPPGVPQTHLLFLGITILAGPALALPILFAKKYINQMPTAAHALMAQDRTLVLLLATLATAMASFILWEKVLPDRRDCRTLGVLPIAPNTFVLARLAAIVGVFALLFAGSTALWTLTLGTIQSMFGAPGGLVRNLAGQFMAMTGLEAAIFFGIVGVQCLIVTTVGPTLAQRLAIVMQVLLVVVTLQLPLLLPGREAFLATSGAPPEWTQSSTLWTLPPLWFLALHETIAGGGRVEARMAAGMAALISLLVPLLALAFYAASYRRLTRLAIEGRPVSPRERRGADEAMAAVVRLLSRRPPSAAVCAFTIRTLVRSQQHRMFLSIWFGVALALIVSSLLPLVVGSDARPLDRPRASVLVVPLILMTLIQAGMRALYALPTEIRANWVFRLREPRRPEHAIDGAAAALVIGAVLPAAFVALISGSWLWGISIGVQHALFCAAAGTMLAQALTHGLDKIPFTCTYVPGKARVTSYWPAYLIAFSTLTYGMATMEAALLRSPRASLIGISIIAVLAAGLWWARTRAARQLVELRFQEEEEDQPVVLSLTVTR